jgi:hypothetical protein
MGPSKRDIPAVDNDVKLTSGAANRTLKPANIVAVARISPVRNALAGLLGAGKQDYI